MNDNFIKSLLIVRKNNEGQGTSRKLQNTAKTRPWVDSYSSTNCERKIQKTERGLFESRRIEITSFDVPGQGKLNERITWGLVLLCAATSYMNHDIGTRVREN